jgi:hypothetical protein
VGAKELGFFPTASNETLQQISDELRSEPALRIFDNLHQKKWRSWTTVSYEDLARWMVWRTTQTSPAQALDDVWQYARAESFPLTHVVVIGGVRVREPVTLAEGVELMPFVCLPESLAKARFVDLCLPPHGHHRALAAFLLRQTAPKVHLPEPILNDQEPEEETRMSQKFEDAILCLTLAEPCGPFEIGSYTATEDWVPGGGIGMGYATVIGPVFSFGEARPTAENLERLQRLCVACRGLASEEKARVRLPMQRLNLALRRTGLEERAIDLGIALETALLFDRGPGHGGITTTLRIRGARLLGRSFGERQMIQKTLREVYVLRSMAVHSGKVPAEHRGEMTHRILYEGSRIAAAAIEKQILEGRPDWDRVLPE